MRVITRTALTLVLLLSLTAAPAVGQTQCTLSPIFGLFRDVAGVDVVGECVEAAKVAENGDVAQATTKGVAIYRYADQVVTFTDWETMWAYGPEGLQERGFSERFAWEQQPASAPAAPVSVQAVPAPPPEPPRSQSKLTPALAVRCSNLGADLMTEGAPLAGAAAARFGAAAGAECRQYAEKYGAPGVDCFEPAVREMTRSAGHMAPGTGQIAARAAWARIDRCIASLPR